MSISTDKVLITKKFHDDFLFAVAFHPEKNEFVIGLSSGRVECYSYETSRNAETLSSSPNMIQLLWETKRHKSSVRCLAYTETGSCILSASRDGVVKRSRSATGKVAAKTHLESTIPAVIKVTDSFVIIGDEDGSIHALDAKSLEKKFSVTEVHEDMVTAIIDLESKSQSKYRFLTAGSNTVAQINLRKSKAVSVSDEQDDEILCGALVSPTISVFGMSDGILTVWYNDNPEDQHNRIRISKESIDCCIAAEGDNEVYAGCADGIVKLVDAHSSKTLSQWTHSKTDEVSVLELDYQYRLVSCSLEKLIIWGLENDVEEKKLEDEDNEDSTEPKKNKKEKKKHQQKKKDKTNQGKPGIASFTDL